MQTSASKAQRISELEAELAELMRPEIPAKLSISGRRKAVVKTTVLSDPQTIVTFTAKGRRHLYLTKTQNVPVIEYED